MPDNEELENIEFYVGAEYDVEDNGPSICIEFPISIKVFFIAVILAEAEKRCNIIEDPAKEEDSQKKERT